MSSEFSKKAKHDITLVKRAQKNGDSKAFNELMSRHRDPVFFMLLERVNDEELAKELTIEAFGKAFNKIHLYTPKFAFSTWLYTIARNNMIDHLRKKKVSTISIDKVNDSNNDTKIFQIPSENLNPEKQLEKKQRIKILRSIVEKLKPTYRTLVKLRYFKEYTYDEISVEMDIPLGTVKAKLFRAREQLFSVLSGKKEIM